MRTWAALRSALLAVALSIGCASSPVVPADAGVTIEGNSAVGESDLAEMAARELRSFVEHGRRAADLADAAYAMERGLHELGYAHADVSFTAEPSEEHADKVTFRVREGPRAELGTVTFPGASVFSRDRLLEFFKFPPADLLGLQTPPYRLSDVEGAIENIGRLYLLDGYADVTVGPMKPAWNDGLTVVDIEIPIVEGPRYVVTSVAVEGAGDPALEAELIRALNLTGHPWHVRVAAEAAAVARRFLLGQGRRAATAEGTAEVLRDDTKGARIVVRVKPGPVYRLGDVTISGNEHTRTGFLRDLVRMQPGDVLGQKAIDDAINRLYGTGVLRAADAATPGVDASPDAMPAVSDLAIAVEELESRSVELGLGWGSYERARGHVEFRDRNLFGLARDFSVKTSASVVGRGVETSLTDRYLLGRPNTVQLAAALSTRQEPSFERRTLFAEASVRHDLREGVWLKGGYRARAEEARAVEGRIPGAEEEGFVRSAGVFLEGTRDRRDDPLFPKTGSLVAASLFRSAPGLGADLDFIEAKLSATKYVQVVEGTVVALGFGFITRDPQDDRVTLPIQERLFLGGADSVRSFGESELGPTNAAGEPVGGLTSLEAHVELRQRLRGNLEGALFYDVGTVGSKAWQIDAPRGHAIGAGLRYRLPVGPIRLDFAWNPGDRFAADRPWAIHFSFGFTF